MEIRKDYLLDRWVILSPKRVNRPHVIKEETSIKDKDCFFCPGNESKTPKSIIEKPLNNWRIRVFENKFPAVVKQDYYSKTEKLIQKISAYGKHYIIVDTEQHNLHPADYGINRWRLWFETIADLIYMELSDENINYVSIFKNHGVEAGASQPHPHTQVISLPIVPSLIKQEIEKAEKFYDFGGKCIFCEILNLEKSLAKRVVFDGKKVLVLCPYAPTQPFEAWIFPKHHVASIQLGNKTRDELLISLEKVLKAYKRLNVSFNFMFHMLYPKMSGGEKYHFHIELIPRIERDAGLEYGSGINITTVTPEDSAKFLRKFFK
ncbi:MAG: galactose-1-phosphate uridylyltransferase [Candidatus Aenigmarchaeota archaeon]|nr:galactose-1-phosphate uridylyltransferase [Candidatus Aenigmarchaeota archaeon]